VGLPALESCTDRELLESYRQRKDETAFAMLVRRHGPLVWGTCRRLLGESHDTEDAYQAVFLVLARKAGSIRKAESLAAWLHRVARQVALRARTCRDRRCKVENRRRADAGTESQSADTSRLSDELSLREGLVILDEEIERLPEKFRACIVLCYLQGRTNEEAARELGCPAGTLKSRLGRARELLGERLMKRGVALSVGAAAVLVATSAGEAALAPEAVRAAAAALGAGLPSPLPSALRLAREFMRTMTMNKIKLWAVGFLTLAIVGAGVGTLMRQTLLARPPLATASTGGSTSSTDQPKAKADLHGDALPDGAVVRLGTVRWRHGMRGNVLAFTPGGKEIVTSGPDGLVRVWDVATGRELRRLGTALDVTADPLRPSAVTANGRWAATTGKDRVHVWDVESGKELQQIKVEKPRNLLSVALTSDGKSLLLSGYDDGVVLWDVATGKEQRRFETIGHRIVFSEDGKLLAMPYFGENKGDGQKYGVRLLDVATGKEACNIEDNVKDFKVLPPGVLCPVFSPDGKVLARVAIDGTIRLHDTKDGRQQRSLGKTEDKYLVSGMLFSPDSKSLAVQRRNRIIQLIDAATGKELSTLDDGHERSPTEEFEGPVTSTDEAPLAFAANGKTLAVLDGPGFGQNAVRLWDTATGKPLPALPGHEGAIVDLAQTVDGKELLTLGADRTLRQWDMATGKEVNFESLPAEKAHGYLTNGVGVLSKTGRLLAYPADKETFALWDVNAGKARVKITLTPEDVSFNPVNLASFSADEKVLATAEWNGTLRLWDTANGKEMRALDVVEKHESPVSTPMRALEFSTDGKMLLYIRERRARLDGGPVASSSDSTSRFCLWDTATGKKLRQWDAAGSVSCAVLSPDGRSLVTAAGDCVTLWETATGKERCRVKGAAKLVACSPDGGVLAVSAGSIIRLLDAHTCQQFARLEGHEGDVQTLTFTRDGKSLVTGSADSTALVWNIARLVPVPKIDEQSGEALEKLWTDLGGDDTDKAYRAAAVLAASPKGTAALLAKQLKPVVAPEPKQLARLIADLDSENFDVRQKASQELARLGELSRPALEDALKNEPSLELHRRIEELLACLVSISGEDLRHLRGVEVLERMGTPEATKLLEDLAKGPPAATLTREANASLRRLGK
jgi:RNA polymerase sigma factor (sigma-70 family)